MRDFNNILVQIILEKALRIRINNFNIIKNKLAFFCEAIFILFFCSLQSVLASTSNDHIPKEVEVQNEEIMSLNAEDVNDTVLNTPISYKVIITDLENSDDLKVVKENIEAYLYTLPKIKRVNFEARESHVTENVMTAIKVFGYYSGSVSYEFKSNDSASLNVYVKTGKPTFIRNVEIVVLGEGLTDPNYMRCLRKIKVKNYSRFKHSDYEDTKSLMLSQAVNLGYFNAHFVTASVYVNKPQNIAIVHLVINTGKNYKFGDVTYQGDTQYADAVKSLETFEKGKQYDSQSVTNLSASLYNTGYFQSVDVQPDILNIDNYTVPINVTLHRKTFNIIETGIGFSTDEGIRGTVKWDMPLVNERGDSIIMRASASAIKQEALFRYTIPRKNPLTNYYYIQAQKVYDDLNDTDSDITSFQIHKVKKDSNGWTTDSYLNYQYEDFTQGVQKGFAKVFGPGVSYTYMKAVPKLDPRKGEKFVFNIFGSYKLYDKIVDTSFIHLYSQAKWLASPTRNSRFIIRAEAGANIGRDKDDIPPSYRFFTGGDTTVRGFGYKKLSILDSGGYLKGGNFLLVDSAEIQVPVMDKMREVFFVDSGTTTTNMTRDTVDVGVGTGIRYISPIGIIKLDFGAGVSRTHVPFHIHFGIGPDL